MNDTQSSDRQYNRVLGAARLTCLFIFLAAFVYYARPNIVGIAVGAVLVAVGEAVRFWAAGHLLKTKELVISGPYRHTRNPLYLGRFLILTGLCIAAALPYYFNWVILLLGWVVFFGYYMRRKERVEPARLREEHGEPYERYFKAVPALFPALKPYDQPSDLQWSVERMLRNREQWMVVGLSLTFVFLIWRALTATI